MPEQQTNSSKNGIIIAGIVLVLLILGGLIYAKTTQQNNSQPDSLTSIQNQSPIDSSVQTGVKEFTVTGSNFKFEPATITVKKGDKVKINFKNDDGIHDLVIDEFNVRTKKIRSGDTDSIEFNADKTGTFEYYCSVSNHRAMGMVGSLIVQ